MGTRLFILDLDHTLFDTPRFFADLKAAIHRTHKLDLDLFEATWAQYVEPEAGGYDPHAHHQHLLGLSPDQLDEFITSQLGDRDYLYPDATQWLKRKRSNPEVDLVIVTLGRPRYQALKFNLAPLLKPLRKVVVPTNKGDLIRRHLSEGAGEYGLDFLDQPYRSITLIDDMPSTFTALGPTDLITKVRIARPGGKYSQLPTPAHVNHVTSFGEIE